MWKRVADPKWDPRQTAAVRALPRGLAGSSGDVRRVRASSDADQWVVDSPTGGFVRVSGTWDEGWTATVDGHKTDVLRADGIFRGAVVPPGHHTLRFSYSDPDAARGLKVAAVALVAIVALFVTELVSARRRVSSDGGRRAPRNDARSEP